MGRIGSIFRTLAAVEKPLWLPINLEKIRAHEFEEVLPGGTRFEGDLAVGVLDVAPREAGEDVLSNG